MPCFDVLYDIFWGCFLSGVISRRVGEGGCLIRQTVAERGRGRAGRVWKVIVDGSYMEESPNLKDGFCIAGFCDCVDGCA